MAMRKIIIEIDEDDLRCEIPCEITYKRWLKAIKNGVLLPEKHGKIIDADKIEWFGCTSEENCPNKNIECKDCIKAECDKRQVDAITAIIEADGCKWDENQKRDCHTCHYMSENAEFDGEMCVGCLADLSGSKPCYKERQ